jgi:hypothetical protein
VTESSHTLARTDARVHTHTHRLGLSPSRKRGTRCREGRRDERGEMRERERERDIADEG